jgi:hypothetical protein
VSKLDAELKAIKAYCALMANARECRDVFFHADMPLPDRLRRFLVGDVGERYPLAVRRRARWSPSRPEPAR